MADVGGESGSGGDDFFLDFSLSDCCGTVVTSLMDAWRRVVVSDS